MVSTKGHLIQVALFIQIGVIIHYIDRETNHSTMGIKGDKHNNESALTAAFLAEKLVAIGGITTKIMFGGNGVFHKGKMFGLVDSKGRAFLKTNDTNQAKFEKAGALQHAKMPYYSIPDDVLNDQDQLIQWAKSSIAITK